MDLITVFLISLSMSLIGTITLCASDNRDDAFFFMDYHPVLFLFLLTLSHSIGATALSQWSAVYSSLGSAIYFFPFLAVFPGSAGTHFISSSLVGRNSIFRSLFFAFALSSTVNLGVCTIFLTEILRIPVVGVG